MEVLLCSYGTKASKVGRTPPPPISAQILKHSFNKLLKWCSNKLLKRGTKKSRFFYFFNQSCRNPHMAWSSYTRSFNREQQGMDLQLTIGRAHT